MHAKGKFLTWSIFLHALESHFSPSLYEDPNGVVFKLCQTDSVKEYRSQFETLADIIERLSPSFYLICFIPGFKPAIRREVHYPKHAALQHFKRKRSLIDHLKSLDLHFPLHHPQFPITRPSIPPSPSHHQSHIHRLNVFPRLNFILHVRRTLL